MEPQIAGNRLTAGDVAQLAISYLPDLSYPDPLLRHEGVILGLNRSASARLEDCKISL